VEKAQERAQEGAWGCGGVWGVWQCGGRGGVGTVLIANGGGKGDDLEIR
jgi:hypothetical protein